MSTDTPAWQYPEQPEPTEDRIYSLSALLITEHWLPREQTAVSRVTDDYICNHKLLSERVLRTAMEIDKRWDQLDKRRINREVDELFTKYPVASDSRASVEFVDGVFCYPLEFFTSWT